MKTIPDRTRTSAPDRHRSPPRFPRVAPPPSGLAALLLLLLALGAAGCREGRAGSGGSGGDSAVLGTPTAGHLSPSEAEPVPVQQGTWVCPPCAPHDTLRFDEDGTCPVCGMALMEKPDSTRIDDPHLHVGSGNFLVRGGPGHRDDLIAVFYHRPRSYRPDSPLLVVVPGAGRNAGEYRDAWIEPSEEHGVLVLSPLYPADAYGFGQYHMGGLMEEMKIEESTRRVEGTNDVVLDEESFRYRVEENPAAWIFRDFDRIFRMVAAEVGSTRAGYDAFGHSAGGQILHRLTLLAPATKAGRIVAANSGFYTLPDLNARLPFGVADAPVAEDDLRRSFQRRLTLLLGEEDDETETGGTDLRSPSADAQGRGRLARGRHFFRRARQTARAMDAPFRWRLEVVPGVGHDFREMTRAAAKLLYGEQPTEEVGTGRFENDARYRVTGTYEALPQSRELRVASSTGRPTTVRKVGHVRVELPEGTGRLAVFRAGEQGLWIPFRDVTNGGRTYGAGRYVRAEPVGDDRLRIDFNRAYNPPCAYDPHFACPLPPAENQFSFPVEAGETRPAADAPGAATTRTR